MIVTGSFILTIAYICNIEAQGDELIVLQVICVYWWFR